MHKCARTSCKGARARFIANLRLQLLCTHLYTELHGLNNIIYILNWQSLAQVPQILADIILVYPFPNISPKSISQRILMKILDLHLLCEVRFFNTCLTRKQKWNSGHKQFQSLEVDSLTFSPHLIKISSHAEYWTEKLHRGHNGQDGKTLGQE